MLWCKMAKILLETTIEVFMHNVSYVIMQEDVICIPMKVQGIITILIVPLGSKFKSVSQGLKYQAIVQFFLKAQF